MDTTTSTLDSVLAGTGPQVTGTWLVTRRRTILRIAYGRGRHFPQYGALHLDSSYFRLTCGPPSGWGTSVLLLPVVWRAGRSTPDQGAPVTAHWHVEEPDLVLAVGGTMAGLSVTATVRLSTPATTTIAAQITTTVQGTLALAQRPGEAFKPVMLSSMHVSPAHWDTHAAFAGGRTFPIPEQGWISPSPVTAARFGLQGGRSRWQVQAPTIEVVLERPLPITGWVTPSHDPNDDNVGWWATADQVVPAWSFTVRGARCVSDGAGHIDAAAVRWSRPCCGRAWVSDAPGARRSSTADAGTGRGF